MLRPLSWRSTSATEKYALRWVVPNEEKERMVSIEILLRNHAEHSNASSGSRSFCAFLVHVYKSLVDNFREKEVACP